MLANGPNSDKNGYTTKWKAQTANTQAALRVVNWTVRAKTRTDLRSGAVAAKSSALSQSSDDERLTAFTLLAESTSTST